MLACVYGAYLIVGSVIDHRVALIQKYIYGIYIYIYIWKYLVYYFHIYLAILDIQLRAQIYLSIHITVGLG